MIWWGHLIFIRIQIEVHIPIPDRHIRKYYVSEEKSFAISESKNKREEKYVIGAENN